MSQPGNRLELWVFRHYRSIHAVKTTLACLLVLLCSLLFQLPHGSWALITIVVVMAAMPQVGSSLERIVLRGLGTLTGGVYALGVLIWLPDSMAIRIPAIILGVGVGAWLATDRRISYAGIVLALTVALVLGDIQPITPTEGMWRLGNVLLGGITTAVVTLGVLPIHASRKLLLSLSGSLRELSEMYLLSASPTVEDPAAIRKRLLRIQRHLSEQTAAIGPAIYESRRMRRFKSHYQQIVTIEQRLLSLIEFLYVTHSSDLQTRSSIYANYDLLRVRWGYGTIIKQLSESIKTNQQVDMHVFEQDIDRLHATGQFYLEQSRQHRRLATSGYLWQHYLLAEQLLSLGLIINDVHRDLERED